jgi:PhnB protein
MCVERKENALRESESESEPTARAILDAVERLITDERTSATRHRYTRAKARLEVYLESLGERMLTNAGVAMLGLERSIEPTGALFRVATGEDLLYALVGFISLESRFGYRPPMCARNCASPRRYVATSSGAVSSTPACTCARSGMSKVRCVGLAAHSGLVARYREDGDDRQPSSSADRNCPEPVISCHSRDHREHRSRTQIENTEGRPIMTAITPEGYTTVSPWIVTDDTGALLDFIAAAFDGDELARIAVEDGSIGHAEIRVGDTVLLAFDRREDWPVMPSLLRVYVPDADAAFEKAVAAGARVVTQLADSAWGDRGGRLRDPFGNIWWVMARVEDVEPEESWRRLSEPVYAESMRDAQETLDAELSGRTEGRASAPLAPDA